MIVLSLVLLTEHSASPEGGGAMGGGWGCRMAHDGMWLAGDNTVSSCSNAGNSSIRSIRYSTGSVGRWLRQQGTRRETKCSAVLL